MAPFKKIFYQNDIRVSCIPRHEFLPFSSVLFPLLGNEILAIIHVYHTHELNKTYKNIWTSKYSRTTLRESLHESSTRFPARSWPSVAKCLSNEECNEELHFPVSCYCNCHTDSCKNYKNSQLYNRKHYLINTCVLGGNICLGTLFSNNVIYPVCPYVQHQTCDRRLLPSSCVSVPPHRATGIPLYGF